LKSMTLGLGIIPSLATTELVNATRFTPSL